jgi:hypothetical protein
MYTSLNTNNFVTKEEDEFTFEKCRWLAHLSNGEIIIQDDGRPGMEPPSAWLRLKEYCKQNNVNIINVSLQFRSNHVSPLPAYADGYFFANKYIAIQGGFQGGFYLVGVLINDIIQVHNYSVPALEYSGTEIRKVEDAGDFLIKNHGNERIE